MSAMSLRVYWYCCLLVSSCFFSGRVLANQLSIYDTPGTYTYTVPAGVTSITIEAWGGGGRGGSTTAASVIRAGGGGGGGAYARVTRSVTAGQTFTVVVGAGSNTTSAGADSTVSAGATLLVRAKGGSSAADNSTTAATGGAVGSSVGDVTRAGGNGAAGSTSSGSYRGGGGGSSAGPNNPGNNASASAGGVAVTDGGGGGNAAIGAGNGIAGVAPGGGGGGAANCANCGVRTGGRGGDGQVRISYVLPDPAGCFSDDFNRSSLGTDWVTNVTAGTFQPQIVTVSGDGRLRMTQAVGNQATAATLQRLLPAADNYVVVEFDYFAYGGSGADGVAIVLSDATVTPRAGSFGGALGYAQRDDGTAGFAGGWLGMGLDEYGNFPVAGEGKQGGVSALVLDNVSIRGSGVGSTGYRYLAHSLSLSPGVDGTSTTTPHRYRIEVDSTVTGRAVVRVQRNTGSGMQTVIGPHDILEQPGQAAVPDNFLLSITGSTGGSTNVHEFGSFRLCARHLLDIGDIIDHFELNHPGSGVTCQPTAVTVRACLNAACTELYTDPVTVTLSPTGWVGGDTITFSGGSTTAYFRRTTTALPFPTLGVTTSTPITRPFTQTLCRNGGSAPAANQCQLTMQDAGLIVTVPDLIASRPDTTAQLRAVRASDNAQVCVPAFEHVTRSVRFWTDYVDPGASGRPASLQVQVNGSAVGLTSGTQTPVNINFGAGGVANMTVNYADAGRLQLNARYEGSAATSDAGLVLTGAGQFVSRPVGLCVQTGGECASADASCPLFRRAGQTFPLTLRAVGWQMDGDTDLCTGNTATPNFALTNIGLTAELVAPAGGEAGSVTPASYNHLAAANGQTQANVSASEVGVFRFRATPGNYLGGAMGGGLSAPTGRFYPDHFALSMLDVGSLASQCSASPGNAFTYTGQPFGWQLQPEMLIEARAAGGTLTRNYTHTGFRKLQASNVQRTFPATDTAALGTDGNPLTLLNTHADGELLVQAPGQLRYRFSAGDEFRFDKTLLARVAPFQPQLSFGVTNVSDSDGVTAPLVPLNFQPASTGDIRYGHVRMENVYGPETLAALPMPFYLEYWQGSRFVTNTHDGCWGWNSADVTTSGNHGTIAAGSGTVLGGQGGPLSLQPNGTTGTDELQWTVPVWLQDFWQSTTTLENPEALATFGVFRGHDRVIYWREVTP